MTAAVGRSMGAFSCILLWWFCIVLVFNPCFSGTQFVGQLYPGFKGSQIDYIDKNGLFLRSSSSIFALGFYLTLDGKSLILAILHLHSSRVVWTANRRTLVRNSDKFVFNNDGNVYLEHADGEAWSTQTKGKGATALELGDNGNLVLLDKNRNVLWQSFSYPSDTLLPGQVFSEGMKLRSFPRYNDLYHYLEFKSGDMILYVGYRTPQIYWSMDNDIRKKTVDRVGGRVSSASLESNFWNLYDQNQKLVSQFVFSEKWDANGTWAVILGADGSISFFNLEKGKSGTAEATRIPQDSCAIPEPCRPLYVCSLDNRCQCPPSLMSYFKCEIPIGSTCTTRSKASGAELLSLGEKLRYFALDFALPFSRTDLNGCRNACHSNCSCLVLFFQNSSGNCYLFDQIGSLQRADQNSSGFISFVKVQSKGDGEFDGLSANRKKNGASGKPASLLAVITVLTALVVSCLVYLGVRYTRRKTSSRESSDDTSEEDESLGGISGTPIRYSFKDLREATENFSKKLGRGGFGSVYQGSLRDGTCVAVKKLENVGQGKKQFRAEVSSIGNVHHIHLVKLRGFCSEGAHRLLVYEYMGRGSLDKWIFNKEREPLDWETRFNIALGTAKGLAYLHEECDVKIVHCDIKPENVLLDDHFLAKVSDFGLSKLMNREQSLVFTTLRGTRGYLAPEWITNHAISEKSDVYSFGIVLLEIIGGRRSYQPEESSGKSYFPSFAFEMMGEGRVEQIIDPKMEINEYDERVVDSVKVALLCIQDDMNSRPSMAKVVQMMEGLCAVPQLPSSQKGFSVISSSSGSEKGTSIGPIDHSSAFLSNVHLSGPR